MEESLLIYKIGSGLIIPSIIGMVKIYADLKVLKNSHENLNEELQEYKKQQNESVTNLGDRIDKRMDKLETLIEKLFTYDRDHKKS
jgi:hypothetical protein